MICVIHDRDHEIKVTKLNNLLLDMVNDIGLEPFVTSPTRQESILDLVFSTYSNISDLQIIPDHEAVVFCIDIQSVNTYNKLEHNVWGDNSWLLFPFVNNMMR